MYIAIFILRPGSCVYSRFALKSAAVYIKTFYTKARQPCIHPFCIENGCRVYIGPAAVYILIFIFRRCSRAHNYFALKTAAVYTVFFFFFFFFFCIEMAARYIAILYVGVAAVYIAYLFALKAAAVYIPTTLYECIALRFKRC